MGSQQENTELEWRDGKIPVSTRFDDPYFSLDDGMAETAHVFLTGNHLPHRFSDRFQVAELGFGTGLNLLCLWKLWRDSGQKSRLSFTSFEAFPLSQSEMQRAHAMWPELADISTQFFKHWDAERLCLNADDLRVQVILGDARKTLPEWQGFADAWFLDGFSPAKNPELWSPALMTEVGRHTRPNGTFATYTAAGHVRTGLAEAGFSVTRVKGFGRKRHMSIGTLTSE